MKTSFWTMPGVLALIVTPIIAAAPPANNATTTEDGRVLSPYAETFYAADPIPTGNSQVTTSPDRDWTCAATEAARCAATVEPSFAQVLGHISGAKAAAGSVDATEEASEPPVRQSEPAGGCPFQKGTKCPQDTTPFSVLNNLEKLNLAHDLNILADRCVANGEFAAAARIYQQIAELVPGTHYAERAKSQTLSRTTTPGPDSVYRVEERLPAIDSTFAGAMAEQNHLAAHRGSRTTQVEAYRVPLTGEETAEPPIAEPYDDWSLPLLILEPIHVPTPIDASSSTWDAVRSMFHNATGIEVIRHNGTFRAMIRGMEFGW